MRQLNNKFKIVKPVNIFEEVSKHLLTGEPVETTPRKIYKEDYDLLKQMAVWRGVSMLNVLDDVMLAVEDEIRDFNYDLLPVVLRPAYVINSHKSIRIPTGFIRYLEDHAMEANVNMKQYLCRCIRYYAHNHMPPEFWASLEFQKKQKELERKAGRRY